MHDTLVILAGGMSSRMKKSQPVASLSDEEIAQANERDKGLIGVGTDGRPLLDYLLYNAQKAGHKRVIIVTGEANDMFKEFYGSKDQHNSFFGLDISYAIQLIPAGREKPMGTADALYQAIVQYPKLKEQSFTMCNSDNLYSVKAFRLIMKSEYPNVFINYDRDGLDFPEERIERFAITVTNDQNELVQIIEKPSFAKVEQNRDKAGVVRVSMNLFKFSGAMIFPFLENCPVNPVRGEKELPTAVVNMVKAHPGAVTGIPLKEHVPDLTIKKDISTVRRYLRDTYGAVSWEAD